MIGVDQPVLDIDHLRGWIGREDLQRDIERLAVDLRDSADFISEALFGVSRGVRQSERRIAAGRAVPRSQERSR